MCGSIGQEAFCTECMESIVPVPEGTCPKCGVGDIRSCAECDWMGSLDWLRVFARYESAAGRAVRNLKFHRHVELASPMGEMMTPLLADVPEFDAVVPVPIHWARLSVRGFNQADLLARAMGFAPLPLLARVKPTRPQAQISGRERLVNLEQAIQSQSEARGFRVLVVDDVVTSGSTMEACASALKSAGASWVGGVAFAKTQIRN